MRIKQMMVKARKGVRGAVEYVMMAHRHHLQLNSVKSTSEGNSLRCGARYFLHGSRVAVIWPLPPFGPRLEVWSEVLSARVTCGCNLALATIRPPS